MNRKHSGFSLVEMAMALTVGALVVSVAAPMVAGTRTRSIEAACENALGRHDSELVEAASAHERSGHPWPAYAAVVEVAARHREPNVLRVADAPTCADAPLGSPNCAFAHTEVDSTSQPCQAQVTPRRPDGRYAPGWVVRYTSSSGEDLSYDLGFHPPGPTAFTGEISAADPLVWVCHGGAPLAVTELALEHHLAHGDEAGSCGTDLADPEPTEPPAPPAVDDPEAPPAEEEDDTPVSAPPPVTEPEETGHVCHGGVSLEVPLVELTLHLLHGDLLGLCLPDLL